MSSTRRTSLRAASTGVAAVLLLGACAGSGGDPGPEESAPSASSGSSGSSSSGASGESAPGQDGAGAEETVSAADLGQRMLDAMTAAGTASFTGETTTADGASSTTQGVVRFEGAAISTRGTTQAQGQTIEVLLLPGEAYVDLGRAGGGPPWLRVTADSADPVAAAMAQFLDSFAAVSDPRSAVEVYRQAGDLAVAGAEDVDGVATTHYTGEVPPQALLAGFPEEMRAGLEPMLGTEPFPVEIWLDAQDRPVRFVQTVTIQDAPSTSTQTFSGWGEPVEIEAPPADQVQG